ncbi:ATPase, T2SS/T4P/T4SS family (plasmid) [Pantoea allii]|uniref:ATPase, T2SS/T4P/T4SS family n=1 Tax=Pantoea allii TaxID=574096 RepID=UPI0039776C78
MITLSEKTHSLLPLEKPLNGRSVSPKIRENIRLIRNNQNEDLCLYVLTELDQDTEFLDLRQYLREQKLQAGVRFCDREQLSKISEQFSATSDSLTSASDFQNENLSLIEEATKRRGSDIHIRIESTFTRVLYRIDGNLRRVRTESVEWGERVCNTLFNSMSEEHSQPVLSYTEPCVARVREEFVNAYGLSTVRFASRPGGQGKLAVALRLVSRRKQTLKFDQLGLTPAEEITLRRLLTSSGGTLFSGPTGHGKSTICQCSAEFLAAEDEGENILSVESPVESPIQGVFQTPKGKQSMAEAIANLLQMDPDRLYIGEILNAGAAQGYVEAIHTGTPALTTIHTHSPADIPQRLKRFGIDEDLLFDPTIICGLVGQRLVPLLCPECKIPWEEGKESIRPEMRSLVETFTVTANVFLRRPGGCECCGKTGVDGRIGIFEVIETDNVFMRRYAEEGKMSAYLGWIAKGGVTLCQNLTRLINEGRADPVWGHRRICNLNRDARIKAGEEM